MKSCEIKYKSLTEYNNIIDNNLEDEYLNPSIPKTPVIQDTYFNYDFNNGFRIKFNICNKEYYIIIRDLYTKYIYFEGKITPDVNTVFMYIKKYLINYEILVLEVSHNIPEPFPIRIIKFNLNNKNVLMYVSGCDEKCGLGDTIAALQSIAKFHTVYPNTNVYVVTSYQDIDDILQIVAPWMNILTYQEAREMDIFYASYQHGCFYDDINKHHNPIDYRQQSLIDFGYNVLGLEKDDTSSAYLKFNIHNEDVKRNKPYICIGVKASCISKEWIPTNLEFDYLIDFLETLGYDVIFIDINNENNTNNLIRTKNPSKGIHLEGNIHLIERIKLLQNCDAFIGVSSGLSWLAWSVNVPVVMISGFTNPITEFKNPYRVINYVKCNSCWNDMTINERNIYGCPKKKDAFNKEFLECSFSINVNMIIDKLLKINKIKEKYDLLFNKK